MTKPVATSIHAVSPPSMGILFGVCGLLLAAALLEPSGEVARLRNCSEAMEKRRVTFDRGMDSVQKLVKR